MSNLPTVTKTNEVAAFGHANIEAKDLIVPTARILQKMSKALDSNPGYRPGEIRDSLAGELLGGETKPLKVVIFSVGKQWIIRENGEEKKFVRYEPYTIENCTRPWDFEEDGRSLSAHEVFNFTCLNVEDPVFPIVFPMQSMAIKHAARKLTTIFSKLQAQDKAITSLIFEIRTQKLETKGVFWVPSVTISEDQPSAAVLERARYWWEKLQTVTAVTRDAEDDDLP